MTRKFDELTLTEQHAFKHYVDFMRETWNEDIRNKLNVVRRFNLDIGDPVVIAFLEDMYVPHQSPKPHPVPQLEPLPPTPTEVPTYEEFLKYYHRSDYQPPNEPVFDEPLSYPIAEITKTKTALDKNCKEIQVKQNGKITYANNQDLIIIQNRLLHAISHLALNERRLILFLSPIVRKQVEKDPNNRVFYVHVQDFINEYGIKSKNYYAELEKIADSILDKNFFYWYRTKNGKAKKGVNWVSECDYLEKEGRIKIRLDNTVIEMLTVFDKATGFFWTKYQKEWIINLGVYGIIMLEMVLSSAENKGYYTVEHLREKFDCIDTYPRFSDFKLYVINKAIKEIHKYTPIQIKYEEHKTGRVVTGLTFSYVDASIKPLKAKEKNEQESKETNPFANFKMTQKQLSYFSSKIKKATNQDIDEIIDELSNVHLQEKHIHYLKLLEYVPSDWYSDDEIKNHPTPEQIEQAKIDNANTEKQEQEHKQQQMMYDYEKMLANAETFVKANIDKIRKVGIEAMYLKDENYTGMVEIWKRDLLDENARKYFQMINEIVNN